jgi:hypothetical protein
MLKPAPEGPEEAAVRSHCSMQGDGSPKRALLRPTSFKFCRGRPIFWLSGLNRRVI